MKGKAIAALLVLSALSAPALAGNVYRCQGRDGVTTYANKRVSGASCKLVGRYSATPAPRPRPVSAAAESPAAASPAAPTVAVSSRSGNAPQRLVRGQVYSYVGKDGVRHYTSARPRGVSASALRMIRYSYMETCYACAATPGVNFRTLRLNTTAFQDEIRNAAREHGVDEAIVRAIIHAESAFNPSALSRVGAQGLMQLMPATARRFGVSNAFDAGQNIRGGVRYLAWLLKRFDGNLSLAAAGYNAGEGAVDKYKGVPPYNETRRYVERVGILADRYRSAINPVAAAAGGLSAR